MNLLKKFAGAAGGGGFPGMGAGFPGMGQQGGGFPGFPGAGDPPKPDPKPKQEFDDGLD